MIPRSRVCFSKTREREREITAETYTKSTTHWPPLDKEDSFLVVSDKYKWSARETAISFHDSKCHRNEAMLFQKIIQPNRRRIHTVNANLITANFPRESSDVVRCLPSLVPVGKTYSLDFTEIRNARDVCIIPAALTNSKILLHRQKHEFTAH